MIASAQKVMVHVMNLNKDDAVLVITDKYTKKVGKAFYNAATDYGCRAKFYLLPEKKTTIDRNTK